MIIQFIISLFLGILPDVFYTYIYLQQIKEIKNKKFLLFAMLFVIYMVCIIFVRYHFYLYIIQNILTFWLLKKLYKSQINDFFLVVILDLYLFLSSIISYFLVDNYLLAMILYRILLFVPLIFKSSIKSIYKEYSKLWNRHNNKNKIKSITIRNISLIVFNFMIIILYFAIVYISTNMS